MAKSTLDVQVSCFKSFESKEPKSVNLLAWLQSKKYAKEVLEIRQIKEKAKRDKIKASLPAITVSGVFSPSRKEENLIKHSGLICIDVDLKGNELVSNFDSLKEELFHIENVAYVGLSVSGKGFFLIIPIAFSTRHKQHFQALKEDFSSLGLTIDSAPQNVASLRGYSYDPEALFRHDAVPYRKLKLDKKKSRKKKSIDRTTVSNVVSTQTRVENLINQIEASRVDITSDEPNWFRVACALANEFGEAGRDYFHAVSRFHFAYDREEADRKFTNALKGNYSSIGIGTFFKLAKDHLQQTQID